MELAGQLSRRIERYLYMWSGRGVQRPGEAGAEHRRILDAVADHDGRRAKLELEMHLVHTRENIVKLFRAHEAHDSTTA
jgi:DNA-binding GntR family transcriptional regulator